MQNTPHTKPATEPKEANTKLAIGTEETKKEVNEKADTVIATLPLTDSIVEKTPVYIHVRDTIIEFDTLKVKRRK